MATSRNPEEVLRASAGRTLYIRLTRLLISGGTTILRELFDSIHPPAKLPTVLKNPTVFSTLTQLKKNRILTLPQWKTLFPSPGSCGQSKNFDITLLCKLFRNICSLTQPATGWDSLPNSTDLSLVADLARIKYYRNDIHGHVKDMKLKDEEFVDLWNKIEDTLIRIVEHYAYATSNPYLITKWANAIEDLLRGPLTEEERIHLEELEHWYLEDMDMRRRAEETGRTTEETRKATEETRKVTEETRKATEETRKATEETRKTSEETRDLLVRTFLPLLKEIQKNSTGLQQLGVQVQQEKSVEEKTKYYKCGDRYVQIRDIETWPKFYKDNQDYFFSRIQKNTKIESAYPFDARLNEKISLWEGDITRLAIDAIVNVANSSLLGGGGVDGCIHRTAGKKLVDECRLLNGCETGDAKITSGHKLPAKWFIHTVGPIGEDEEALTSCYKNCLRVALKNKVRTLAFCCVSTGGLYGYPNEDAVKVALKTTREWLEDEDNAYAVDRIIFCLFLDIDIKIYQSLMLKYFPLRC